VAATGAAIAVVSAEVDSFPLLLLGMLMLGSGSAANLLARYAAADLAAPERRARSISIVVWATTIGAVAGPNILGLAGRLASQLDLPSLAGPYVIGVACFAVASVLTATALRPDPLVVAGGLTPDDVDRPRRSVLSRLEGIMRHPAAGTGLATMVVAHAVMVSVMTMTPLHIRDHGGSLELVGVVISVHIAGMYALAPVVGFVTDRVGELRMAHAAAATLVIAAGLAAAAGHSHIVIGIALLVLGLAWSMATISGAALLTAAVPIGERAETQGVADTTMGFVGGLGGIVSGIVVGVVGYGALSLIGAIVAAGLGVLLVTRSARVRPAVATPTGGPQSGGR
jgi:MFS family permease